MVTPLPSTDFDAARTFLATIFGEGVPGQVAISTRHQGSGVPITQFFRSILDAAIYACEHAEKEDVYYRVTTLKHKPNRGRGKDTDSLAMPGLTADLDVGFSGNNARKYPPNEAAAIGVIDGLGIPPPTLVGSGGGLHALWLLKEPLLIESTRDVLIAKAILKAWNDHLNDRFGRSGWRIDPPGGLSKLMRLPGTFNHKTGTPRPVALRPGPANRWPSIRCLFEDAGLALPTVSISEAAARTHLRPLSETPLPSDAARQLVEDPIAGRLLGGSLHTRKSPSEDDLWLLIRADSLGVDWKRYAFDLLDTRRAASGVGWGVHDIDDYVRRTVRRAEEALLNPRQINGPGPYGRFSYRDDVLKKCWVARDLMLQDGLKPSTILVLEEMCRWSKDGITVAVAQDVIRERLRWRSLQPVRDGQRALRETGWLLPLVESKRGEATTYGLLLDLAFHTDMAS